MTVPLMCSQQPVSFATDNLDDSKHEPSLDIFSDSLHAQASSMEARASETSPNLEDVFPDDITPPRPHLSFAGSDLPATPRTPTKPRARFEVNTPTTPTRPRLPTGSTNAQHLPNMVQIPSPLPPSSAPRYSYSPPLPLEDPRESLSPAHVSSDHVSEIDYLTEKEKRILAHANRIRSTRIPDLLRRISKLWATGETSIYDLIIEIKKADFLVTTPLAALHVQIMEQARHIFMANPMVQSIGCILAIGDRWRYEEAHRSHVITSGSNMETGSDYVDRPSDPHTSSTRHHSSLPLSDRSDEPQNRLPLDSILHERFKDTTMMVSLCDDDSDRLLGAVYKRLKTLNPSYWSDEGIEQVEPGAITLRSEFDIKTDDDVYEGGEASDSILDNEDF
jgi:hypothetical protein